MLNITFREKGFELGLAMWLNVSYGIIIGFGFIFYSKFLDKCIRDEIQFRIELWKKKD